jgi:integrase/recombinase XerD
MPANRYRGDGKRLRAMLLLLRYSGLRISDAVQLKRRRVKDGRLHVYTQKTGQPVRIPLPEQVLGVLAELPEGDRYFWSGRGKVKSCIEDWRRSFANLAELADVEHVSFHRLRNTLAVSLLEKGVSVEDVAVILGNSSRVVARHYSPWVKSRQENLEKSIRLAWNEL